MSEKYKILEHTDDIIAMFVVIGSLIVMGYQSIESGSITFPTEPMMLVLGYFFGKKMSK